MLSISSSSNLPISHAWQVLFLQGFSAMCPREFTKPTCWDFPGGTVVKNPPANAGDTGSSPGPGRSHMPRSYWARVPQLLSPCATTTEAHAPRARAPQREATTMRSPHTATKSSPLAATRESLRAATKTQCSPQKIPKNLPADKQIRRDRWLTRASGRPRSACPSGQNTRWSPGRHLLAGKGERAVTSTTIPVSPPPCPLDQQAALLQSSGPTWKASPTFFPYW